MRATSGEHFVGLDHVRALAAFMVFTWHFTHRYGGQPVPFGYAPAVFPLSLLDEGHTGVALFMTLSGYLFAKLLDGRSINYTSFLFNRALRLLPLLTIVVLIWVWQYYWVGNPRAYAGIVARTFAKGLLFPALPNGGWSITIEFHYYLLLPVFLWMLRKSKWLPLTILAASVALRAFIHHVNGEVQSLAHWTLVGRIDQFTLGMLAFHFRPLFIRRHLLAIGILGAFSLFYWTFDVRGGLNAYPSYPSPSRLWIILPTVEGLAYAAGIAWYDQSFSPQKKGISGFIGRLGEYSYSIYLLHFFLVFKLGEWVEARIVSLSNFYAACLGSVIAFLLVMAPIGYLSYRLIESPFLKLRKRYTT